jgi:hypothetical protein
MIERRQIDHINLVQLGKTLLNGAFALSPIANWPAPRSSRGHFGYARCYVVPGILATSDGL